MAFPMGRSNIKILLSIVTVELKKKKNLLEPTKMIAFGAFG